MLSLFTKLLAYFEDLPPTTSRACCSAPKELVAIKDSSGNE